MLKSIQMLDLVFKNFTEDKSIKVDFFERIINVAIKELNLKEKGVGISLNLVGESKIKELNKKYRNKNKVTDVLSFPMLDMGSDKLRTKNYELRTIDLGDIFICLSFAKKEAKSENIDIEQKLAWLTVHGLLHLAGYDHEKSKKDADAMFEKEKLILSKLDKK